MHSTQVLNALVSSFKSASSMHNLCLVCDKILYLDSYVLVATSSGITFCSDVYTNFYEPIIYAFETQTQANLLFELKLQVFATLSLSSTVLSTIVVSPV